MKENKERGDGEIAGPEEVTFVQKCMDTSLLQRGSLVHKNHLGDLPACTSLHIS